MPCVGVMLSAPPIHGQAAIVGVGHTDYAADYARRDVQRDAPGLAVEAFGQALADAGLTAADIDGIGVPSVPGGVMADPTLFAALGVQPTYVDAGSATIESAAAAIAAGQCSTMALVYASEQRSASYQYGGAAARSAIFPSYFYYHPWGFSSQGAHWALMFQRHQLLYGSTEAQLGAVPVALRRHAALNPQAVMRQPLSHADYLAARYVCRPLRLFDYCIVNDGGVVLILRRTDEAGDGRKPPVVVAGAATCRADRDVAQLRPQVLDLQHGAIAAATQACLAMARCTRREIGHFQVYDAFSVNVPIALEGAGFCGRGEGFDFIQDGRIEIGGELPCNTSGGMLSESYMHGWNHAVEAVRQLRGEAGARQVPDLAASLYCLFTSGYASSLLFTRAT